MLNIVVLNGGRGAATLIPALLRHHGLNVTSIVNAYDDGKSTGEIRRFFDMLGPSDIRKVQALMLPENDAQFASFRRLFDFRYAETVDRNAVLGELRNFSSGDSELAGVILEDGGVVDTLRVFVREFVDGLQVIEKARSQQFDFADCSIMNCLYAGGFLACGRDMERTTRTFDRMFRLKGTVLPNSNENKWLAAIRQNGEVLYSEAEIVELRSNVLIDSVYLLDRPLSQQQFTGLSPRERRYFLDRHHAAAEASPGVRLALSQADVIIYSAGTQHSSLYPTHMSRGVAETIASNRQALKLFVTNIGADYETPSYQSSDYLRGAYRYLCLADGRHHAWEDLFSAVLVNNGRRKADETYVDHDPEGFIGLPVPLVIGDFESEEAPGRHDGDKLVQSTLALYEKAPTRR